MSKARLEFISQGFHDLLCSNEMRELVDGHGQDITATAGEGFQRHTFMGGYGGGRWVCTVRAATPEAVRAEATDKTLTKAVMMNAR